MNLHAFSKPTSVHYSNKLYGAFTEKNHTWDVLVLDGAKTIDVGLPVRFGFRELRVEGGWLMCNGSRLHVRGLGQPYGILGYTRPVDDAAMQQRTLWYYAAQKKAGQFWKRGVNKYNAGAFLETADEMGGIATIRIPGSGFTAARLWAGNPAEQARALGLMKWVRNHPSLASFLSRQSPDKYELGTYERQGRSAGGNVLTSSFFWWNQFDEKAIWDMYRRRWDEFVRPYRESYPTFAFMGMWSPYGDFMGNKVGKYGHGVGLQSREDLAQRVSGGRIIPLNAECGWPRGWGQTVISNRRGSPGVPLRLNCYLLWCDPDRHGSPRHVVAVASNACERATRPATSSSH